MGPPEPYDDWHAWALAQFDNDPRRAALAARAAGEAQSVGAGIDAAVRAARSAAGAPAPSWVPNDVSVEVVWPPYVAQPAPPPDVSHIPEVGAPGAPEREAHPALWSADSLEARADEPVPISFLAPTIVPSAPPKGRSIDTGRPQRASSLGARVLSRLLDGRQLAVAIAVLVVLLAGSSVGVAQQFFAPRTVAAGQQASRPPYTVPSPALPTPSPLPYWTPAAKPRTYVPPAPPRPVQSRVYACPSGYQYVPDRFACFRSGQPTFICPAGYAPFAKSVGCYTPGPEVPLPSPIAGATMRYYDISGSTVNDLYAQVNALGITCSGDEAQFQTIGKCPAWEQPVNTSWPYTAYPNPLNGSCTIGSVSFTGHEEVTVPRWTPGPDAPPELYDSWKRWLTGVYIHEAGHVQISTPAFEGIRRSLTGAPCENYSQIVTDGLATLAVAQHSYHLATNFGRNQGPPFP